MNMDLLKQSGISKTYLYMFLSFGLKQKVTEPTRVTILSDSCIDYVLTNDHNLITRVLKTDISDHLGVYMKQTFLLRQ